MKLGPPLLFRQLCLHSITISKLVFCLTFEFFWAHHVNSVKAKDKLKKLWSYYKCSLNRPEEKFFFTVNPSSYLRYVTNCIKGLGETFSISFMLF